MAEAKREIEKEGSGKNMAKRWEPKSLKTYIIPSPPLPHLLHFVWAAVLSEPPSQFIHLFWQLNLDDATGGPANQSERRKRKEGVIRGAHPLMNALGLIGLFGRGQQTIGDGSGNGSRQP
jgi:hypothetical protein